MARIAFSILFLSCFLVQSLYLPLASLYLEFQRDYIADNLCINRFEPELMCGGQCVIDELTIAVAEESQQKTTAIQPDQQSTVTLDLPETLSFKLQAPSKTLPAASFFCKYYAFQFSPAIFRPPSRLS